jgi:hypothetical protein
MILNNAINAGGFIYCMAYIGPHENNTYHSHGDGHYHQYIYILEGRGSGTITNEAGRVISFRDDDSQGQLVDLSAFKDMYHTTKTQDVGLTSIMFNPIPITRVLTVDIVKGPVTKTITAGEKRITVVCITGPITANNKTLASLQHAKVFPGKTAELTLSENTVCALVSE